MAQPIALDSEVQYVRGVGPVRAREFEKLGVRTVADLIELFPFRYELRPKSLPIGDVDIDTTATVVGELQNVKTRRSAGGQTVSATVVDGTGKCAVRWFNSPFLVDKLHHGVVVRLTGKVEAYNDAAAFTNPQLSIIDDADDAFVADEDRYDPVYPATGQLPSKHIAKVVVYALEGVGEHIRDFLPAALRDRRSLPPRRSAVLRYHHPTSPEDVPVARRRLAYDELLLCQLAVQMSRRMAQAAQVTAPIVTTDEIDRRIRKRLPFVLTSGQERAIAEIRADLAQPRPMNRLLQADVGAGKTAVAVYAALAAIANRRQAAILAPTEVLAAQHRAKVEQYLAGSRVRVGYLVGGSAREERAAMLASLARGEIDLLIGTHALIEGAVEFRDLGLVIIDEQHKFGVAQRAELRRKGNAPHTLVLTATPIPRTLAMTFFGDLDVSTIDGAPPGRRPVTTKLVPVDKVNEAWAFIRERLSAGEQAYIVYPLVEESEALPLRAAEQEFERLRNSVLAGVGVGLLHGRMRPSEKEEVMRKFRAGEIAALVATTVIEVGVDVPNATLMVVEHADRYGLSQLHQLRGRVGRGSRASYCLLFTDARGETAQERLRILCETSDGFRVAEEDLRLRGPGELLGTRQHGMPEFRVANLASDLGLLEEARDDAALLLRGDERLSLPEHAGLRRAVLAKYRTVLGFGDVG